MTVPYNTAADDKSGWTVGDTGKITGYSFDGWYTSPTGGDKYDWSTKLTNDVTMYAHWTANGYTVKYDAGGGKGTMGDQKFTFDVPQNLSPNAFTRDGYTFTGWKRADTGDSYTDGQQVSNLTSTPNGVVTMVAQWTPNAAAINYNANPPAGRTAGGQGTANWTGHTGDTQAIGANGWTVDGYTFIGWNTSADGTGTTVTADTIITENMQEGLIVIDKYTMILSANSSAWNLFRVDKVCQGESVYCLDRAEDFRHAIEQVLSGEHAELILKLNGSDIQLIANPVVRGQKTEGAVILLVNVTEKLERENLRREFSANVSHELKTPLTSISGFAEIMQGGLVKCEDIPKFAGRIYKESQRLLQLVEDVIQISQLDEEKTSYTWELVDVYQVCKNAFESLKEKAQSMNVHLYICGDSMKMEAVRTLLEEAVYNVCDNAIKYNRNDGSVSIFLTQTAHEIQIVVKDTGVGIPKEDQDRVFERFYRVDKSHSKEIGGTGLGLSIVKHAVSTLNGSIVLRSEEGSGTEITMKFLKVHKE